MSFVSTIVKELHQRSAKGDGVVADADRSLDGFGKVAMADQNVGDLDCEFLCKSPMCGLGGSLEEQETDEC